MQQSCAEKYSGNYIAAHWFWLGDFIDAGIKFKNFAGDPSKLEDVHAPLDLVAAVGGKNPDFKKKNEKSSCFYIFSLHFCHLMHLLVIQMLRDVELLIRWPEKLTIYDAEKMRSDGLYNVVELNGNAFDKLYGFAGSCNKLSLKSGVVDRMLMCDFDNG
jgi:hypothetical protein